MRYTIRHFDLPLLTFEANMDSAEAGLHIIKVYEENSAFLPLNLTVSVDGVERWLRHRTIPKNRAYVDALLSLRMETYLNRFLPSAIYIDRCHTIYVLQIGKNIILH